MVGQVGMGLSSINAKQEAVASRTEGVVNIQNQQREDSIDIQQPLKKNDVEKLVNTMNDFLKASPNTHLKFVFHDQLNEYYVTIIDDVTNEVVKEIPPKKMLDMFAAMTEFLGLMVDKKI